MGSVMPAMYSPDYKDSVNNGNLRLLDSLLSSAHKQLIVESAIDPEVAVERGYRSVKTKTELNRLGFKERQCLLPALLVPIHGVTGEVVNYQLRPDQPRVNEQGKAIKYETVANSQMRLDVPPRARKWLGDPARPLFITEGARKADAAVSKGLCCVALLGVWNWRGRNKDGGLTALADWESISLKERRIYICFDSDVMTKPAVHAALTRLKSFLEQRGADVALVYLPCAEGAGKVGLDDFFAAGHNVDDLLALASSELRAAPPDETESPELPYCETEVGLLWMKPTQSGSVPTPLTNFTARIISEIAEDDGTEHRRLYEIEARINGRTHRFMVPAMNFAGMSWVTEQLGATALLYPGFGSKDQARAAIQMLSGNVSERRVYVHTGWRKISGEWAYLHAGGAISYSGSVSDVEVRLPDSLMRYALPAPANSDALIEAIRASIRTLRLAPLHITVPLFAGVYRAVLGPIDFANYLAGQTGEGKSELAAIFQQHFGAGLDARHLPGSWASTDNAIEGLGFAVKDALFVIDDFAPGGTQTDVARLNQKADRIFRGQGNSSGRQRMRADGTLRPVKPCRGLILSTGEDIPRGHSIRARLFVLELSPGDLDWGLLTECQLDAKDGVYATALASFIRYLAPSYETVLKNLHGEVERLRQKAVQSGHKRTPSTVANLAVGLRHFLHFAFSVGAINHEESEQLFQEWWDALNEAAKRQGDLQQSAEPTQRFLETISALITSGRAHIAQVNGSAPYNAPAWGWRRVGGDWQPQGRRIGWVDGQNLYLEPITSFSEAQELAGKTGEGITISLRTMQKRMCERGLLVSTDQTRKTNTVRREIEGKRHSVLHIKVDSIAYVTTDQPDHNRSNSFEDDELEWSVPFERIDQTDQEIAPMSSLPLIEAEQEGDWGYV